MSKRTKAWIAIWSVIALLVAGIFILTPDKAASSANTQDRGLQTAVQPAPDSGVITCQEMADRANMTGEKPKLSFADVRAKFQASQDAEIRTTGVKLVDTLEKADKALKGNTNNSESLGLVMAIKVAWLDLQEACGKQGVEIPDLKA